MGQRQILFHETYESISSKVDISIPFHIKLLGNICISEVLRGPMTLHFSDFCISRFSYHFDYMTTSELKPYFLSITNNGFLQERPNLNSDSPYNIHFYRGIRHFTLVRVCTCVDI